MAINKNHEFEDLDGIKCAVVERNCSEERVSFLKNILELNRYEVVVVKSPPPKVAKPSAPVAETDVNATPPVAAAEPPATFTVGVTDVTFNATNAIFGRLLKTKDGHYVTQAFWQQKEAISRDDIPYYEYKA